MINSICMKNAAVYHLETVFSGFKKINLIYGNNGTGKTLISNYLSNPSDPLYQSCSVKWEEENSLPIYVFNHKFCDTNFRGTVIPGIFTLGKENAAMEEKTEIIQKEIIARQQKLSDLRERLKVLSDQKQKQQDSCINALWERSKTYKTLLGEHFIRPNSKIQCYTRVENAVTHGLKNAVIGIPDLKYRADVLNAKKEIEYPIYPYLDDECLAEIEDDPVWLEDLGSGDPEDKEFTNWFRQGVQYTTEDHICPFCDQEIRSDNVLKRIAKERSDLFRVLTARCNEITTRYEINVQKFLEAAEMILKENRDEGAAFLDVNRFADTLTNLRNLFHANILFMRQKRSLPSQSVEIQSSREAAEYLNQLIDESNSGSEQANFMLSDFRRSREDLKKDAWDSFCKASAEDVINYQKTTKSMEDEIRRLRDEISLTENNILNYELERDKLLRNAVNIRDSVDRINKELSSLGIQTIRLILTADQAHYIIERLDGSSAADTLSEGEKTLIMLLYFLQLTEGASAAEKVRADRIVVIDDPVANLDDTALNAVLDRIALLISRILDGTGPVQQLFVLSHRRECTKKLRVCDVRLEDPQNIKLWILRKKESQTHLQEFAF